MMLSPYWNQDFWGFFLTLGSRLHLLLRGAVPLAADEVQIFVLGAIALSCGLLGPFLVLKKMTMLANSLSHTILLGIGVSFFISSTLFSFSTGFDLANLLIGAVISALLTTCLTQGLTRRLRLQEDASIGLVFTSLFALGIVFVTLFLRDVHLGIEAVMGSVDALKTSDLFLAGGIALVNLSLILLLFGPLQCATFDPSLAVSLGLPCRVIQSMLLFLTAVTCIGSFRAVGVLLVLSYLVGPYLIARLLSDRLSRLLILTPFIGIGVSLIGVALSRHLLSVYGVALSTGGMISILIAILYPLVRLIGKKI